MVLMCLGEQRVIVSIAESHNVRFSFKGNLTLCLFAKITVNMLSHTVVKNQI